MKELREIKIITAGKSAEIQKKLFELDEGIEWTASDRDARHENEPFLIVHKWGQLGFIRDEEEFFEHPYKLVPGYAILDLKKEDMGKLKWTPIGDIDKIFYVPHSDKMQKSTEKFKPFQRVLCRDNYESKWTPDFFAIYHDDEPNHRFECVGHYWKYCIPFKGNEHLAGKV